MVEKLGKTETGNCEIFKFLGPESGSNARGNISGPRGRGSLAFVGGCLWKGVEGFRTNPMFLARRMAKWPAFN